VSCLVLPCVAVPYCIRALFAIMIRKRVKKNTRKKMFLMIFPLMQQKIISDAIISEKISSRIFFSIAQLTQRGKK
jgi:hypothetical protein